MAVHKAVIFQYCQPGTKTAILRAYVYDVPEKIRTDRGEELSLGTIQFDGVSGRWRNETRPHGGWNCSPTAIWFAFEWKVRNPMPTKCIFKTQPNVKDGCVISSSCPYPYEARAPATVEFRSIDRWRLQIPRNFSCEGWIKATSSSSRTLSNGYIAAKEGDEFRILYVGTEHNDKNWLYVEAWEDSTSGDRPRGWIAKECFMIGQWETSTKVMPSLSDLPKLILQEF